MTGGVGTEELAAPAGADAVVDVARAREVLAMVRAGRSTYGRAAIALGVPPERLAGDRDDRALVVYRAFVGHVVEFASPLAIRACALNGVSLDGLALRLRPGAGWEHWLCGREPGERRFVPGSGLLEVDHAQSALRGEAALEAWLHGGVRVVGRGRPLRILGVRVLDDGLEMAATIGDHLLRTFGREGELTLDVDLPGTVTIAMPGRPLDTVVGHPLLEGAGCVVTAVEEWHALSRTVIRFALGRVPWRMPWARGRDEAGRGRS